jgi:hypothetical protein
VLRWLTYSSLVQPAGGKANIYGNAVLGATLGCAAAVAHILVKSAGECAVGELLSWQAVLSPVCSCVRRARHHAPIVGASHSA